MGLGYERLRELNKGIIMANVSAYGQYGPYHDRIGFDPIGQAISGMMSLTGFPGNPPDPHVQPRHRPHYRPARDHWRPRRPGTSASSRARGSASTCAWRTRGFR